MRDRIVPALLDWYDAHARDLPWRIRPAARAAGARPDPYRIWLSEVMLQQTTVAAVRDYFHRFTALWPDVASLAAAPDAQVMAEWAGLGYYARARNLIACARAVAAAGGQFPTTRDGLLALPGIGPYTAAAIAAIAYDAPETVVDGNVERVVARLFAVTQPMPAAKPRLRDLAATLTPDTRPGDFAQAMMDLGATICTPRRPACAICPLRGDCAAQAKGLAEALPARSPKPPKPQRQGRVWLARDAEGSLLMQRRPAKGLLGGTLGFPTGGWDGTPDAPPLQADWRALPSVRHVFTHFELTLTPMLADLPGSHPPLSGAFVPIPQIDPRALPGLMRKVWAAAQPHL
ncbi:A/G-specific adenine glycosylase [Paracoccus sp. p4-l81]|uniref:A/G-specific adenine glycosylase n=1 Tax=unclassified Paracoccus (in: a-proteobacteria) TaxID=2688777 RepID=UPI0035B7686B